MGAILSRPQYVKASTLLRFDQSEFGRIRFQMKMNAKVVFLHASSQSNDKKAIYTEKKTRIYFHHFFFFLLFI